MYQCAAPLALSFTHTHNAHGRVLRGGSPRHGLFCLARHANCELTCECAKCCDIERPVGTVVTPGPSCPRPCPCPCPWPQICIMCSHTHTHTHTHLSLKVIWHINLFITFTHISYRGCQVTHAKNENKQIKRQLQAAQF